MSQKIVKKLKKFSKSDKKYYEWLKKEYKGVDWKERTKFNNKLKESK